MMIKLMRWGFTLWMLFFALNVQAESATDPQAKIVTATITQLMKKNDIPGMAVELYVEGVPSSYYFGYADKKTKSPVTAKTVFELGSITKIMTSILVAQEIDLAQMSLSDPLKKYFKDLPAKFDNVTLLNLATHTAGLPFNAPTLNSQENLLSYLNGINLSATPGEEWSYSNVGVGLLAKALEISTDKDYDKLYIRHILNPLAMIPIALTIPPVFQKYVAQGYNAEGQPVLSSAVGFFPEADGLKAASGDMQHFLSAAIGLPGTPERVFYPLKLTQSAFMKVGDTQQGLAWEIHPLTPETKARLLTSPNLSLSEARAVDEIYDKPIYSGDALIDKTGSTNGFKAYIAVIPNKKSGIVILANKNIPNADVSLVARKLLFTLAHV